MSNEENQEIEAEYLAKYPILDYFHYAHLPEQLQRISKQFAILAWELALNLPKNAETSTGLRKLLEAKDCFVRAGLQKNGTTTA